MGTEVDGAGASADDALQWTRAAVEILSGAPRTSDRARIAGAVQMLRDAVTATPEDGPDLPGRLSNLSGALQMMYAWFGEGSSLDESVERGREALARTADGDQHAPTHASNLAAALRTRFEISGDLEDLAESISTGRLAVSWSQATDGRLPGRLSNLCNALRTRWERAGDPESLQEAVDVGRRAAALTRTTDGAEGGQSRHPQRAAVMSNLASALHACYQATDEPDDLSAAVAAGEECVSLTAKSDIDAAGRLSNVGAMQRDLYELTGDPAHLDRAVALAREGLACCSQPRNHAAVLSGLSESLLQRFESWGVAADLAEGVATAREALKAASAGHPDRATILLNLSNAIQVQAETSGDSTLLEDAIAFADEAIASLPADHPNQGVLHNALAIALWRRFEETGRPDFADRAVTAGRTAVASQRSTGRTRYLAGALANLSAALQARYEFSGQDRDLREAVRCARESLRLTQTTSSERAGRAATLTNALRLQFEVDGNRAVLDEAVGVAQAAVDSTPQHGLQRAIRLIGLSLLLQTRAVSSLAVQDARAAVGFLREALTLLDPTHPSHVAAQANLALALQTRFELTGWLADLDEAVSCGREAAGRPPVGDPDRARYLSNQGALLQSRFGVTGDSADLDAAADVVREAVDATAADDARRAARWSNLSGVLRERHEHRGDREDVAGAVAAAREAVDGVPTGHPDRPSYLMKLAQALAAGTGPVDPAETITVGVNDSASNLRALAEARSLLTEAIASTSPADPTHLDMMSNQAGLLMRLFDRTNATKDLDDAIYVIRQVVNAAPPGHPSMAAYESNLGRALSIRFERTRAEDDQKTAESAFRSAAGKSAAPSAIRAGAARGWVNAAAAGGDWPAAAEASTQAMAMITRVDRALARYDQERRLSPSQGMASMAAACCLNAGDLPRAVELLDQGRGVLFSQALDMRSDITRLADEDELLAERFAASRRRLDAPLAGDAMPDEPRRDVRTWSLLQEQRRAAAAEFEAVVAEVRQRKGFERFLLAPELSQLHQAAAGGPVVAINVHGIRSDALILTATRAVKIELPEIAPTAVNQQAVNLIAAVDALTDNLDEPMVGQRDTQAAITEVLGWLWDNVTEPVLRRLDEEGLWAEYRGDRRLWWCPTGALGYLPLHAAGRPGRAMPTSGAPCSVLDQAISSYTPTIRALLDAHHRATPPKIERPEITVVAMPDTPGQADLRSAVREAELIEAAFPGRVTKLIGPAAVRDRVLAALTDRPWVHLACHGATDLEQPAESALLIHDYQRTPLTVADVVRLRLRGAELAYLSACSTAQPGVRLLDESIHLASAFQAAGYRHVIATMWPVPDSAALRATRSVYATLARAGSAVDAGLAVHNAVRAARDRAPDAPFSWASLVHYGA